MKPVLISFLSLYACVVSAFAQPGWKRVAGRDGIRVYARTVPDSKIKAMKAECELNAGIEEVIALLMDVKAAEKWVCHTKSCNVVKRISDTELIYHTEVNLPWPLDNRDFVTHLKVTRDPHTGVVTVDAPAVPGVLPVREGVVRIDRSVNRWIIRPLTARNVSVEYTLQVDPGGHIPAHVVNMFASHAPVETFQNMRNVLEMRRKR